MKRIATNTIVHGVIAVACFWLLVGNVALVYGIDAFGSPFLFAGALVAEIFLFIILLYTSLRALRTPLSIVSSILVSAWRGALTDPYIKRLRRTKSSALRWIGARLTPRRPTGLLLTLGILVTLFFLVNYVLLWRALDSGNSIVQTDGRVMNLMPLVRTSMQTYFFRFVTFTAATPTRILLVSLLTGIFWISRQRLASVMTLGVAVLELAVESGAKELAGRPRPDVALHITQASGFSYPSGHVLSATVLYGLLVYYLYRTYRQPPIRLALVLFYVVSVGLVAVSRIYLGVHYPTDTIGAVYLGLGLLVMTITAIEVATRLRHGRDLFANSKLLIVGPTTLVFSLLASPYFVPIQQPHSVVHAVALPAVSAQTVSKLPTTSETLSGKPAEPIDFIYVGSQRQLTDLFTRHGWYQVDPSTLSNTLKALSIGFQGRQYLTAPVTPFYVAQHPETLAFEKPTQANTLRQRHHSRLWRTGFVVAGRDVWVATASYDEGIEFAGSLKLPTHHIAPDIDAERSYILQSLGIGRYYYVPVTVPQAGQNASGDIFFTDGRAAVVQL